MTLALAQTSPVKGHIAVNVANHVALAKQAARAGAGLVLFSELSLTGYEPELAQPLATTMNDDRLLPLAIASREHNIIIGAGLPTPQEDGICISVVAFYPDGQRRLFSKQFLHADEYPFFVSGRIGHAILDESAVIGLAICYELSVEDHLQQLIKQGAQIYAATVAKSAKGMQAAEERLAHIAQTHAMPALIVNCVGEYDNTVCTGGSAVWDAEGRLLAQLKPNEEGLLLWDSISNATVCQPVDA